MLRGALSFLPTHTQSTRASKLHTAPTSRANPAPLSFPSLTACLQAMPPKSSSRGAPRRSTRASARRSLTHNQSSPVEEPFTPPSAAATNSPLQSSPVKISTASLPSVSSLETVLASETTPPEGTVLDIPNAAALDSGASLNLLGPGNPDPESEAGAFGTERVEEDHGQERGHDGAGTEASGNVGVVKQKRTVKKTIKVVKKIVKKVPRRIVKGGSVSAVEDLVAPEVNDDESVVNTDSPLNCLNSSTKEEEEVQPSVDVPLNIESVDPDVSPPMEVEQLPQKVDLCEEEVEKEQTSEAQGQKEEVKPSIDMPTNIENITPDVSLSMEVEQLQQKVDLCEEEVEKEQTTEAQGQTEELKPSIDMSMNIENITPDVSLSMEVEQMPQGVDFCEDNGEKEQILEVCGEKKNASMEVGESLDGLVDRIDKEGGEIPGEGLAAAANGAKETDKSDVKEDPGGALDAAGDSNVNAEKGTDEVEDGGNAAKDGDEMGVYYSGEMEAMERRKRRKKEIFVGGLDKDAKEEDVRKVFEEVGEVSEVRLVMNGYTGKNKGYAFLRYASAADARKALEKFSKVKICGKECGAVPMEGNDTIYLGSIDKKWKDEDVVKLLQNVGIEGIDAILVMKDPRNEGCNRGFAFVEFETCRGAQAAFKKLQKKDAFGENSKIKVAWAEQLNEPNEAEMQKVKTVYVEYIPMTWGEEEVKENFKRFGEIEYLVLSRNLPNAKRKDYAFISYKTREAAIQCIDSFKCQLQSDDGTKANVKVSLARPISRGRQSKQAPSPVSKALPRERSKPRQGHVAARQIDPRVSQGSTIHHYAAQRPHFHQNIALREERSSTTTELVQLLREQAGWRPPHAGPFNADYPTTFSGRKRPIEALGTDPAYPGIGGYPPYRFGANLPSSSRYGEFPQGGTSTSTHYQGQPHHPPGLPYGIARNFSGSEPRNNRAHGGSSMYHRRH